MANAKFLKLGASLFLTAGVLAACGDENPVEEQDVDVVPEEDRGDADDTEKDKNTDPETDTETESEGEENKDSDPEGEDNIDAEDTEVGDES